MQAGNQAETQSKQNSKANNIEHTQTQKCDFTLFHTFGSIWDLIWAKWAPLASNEFQLMFMTA